MVIRFEKSSAVHTAAGLNQNCPALFTWIVNVHCKIFHSFDAEEIIKINIPSTDTKDRVAWHHERNGVFSVRSAYKLAASLKTHAAQEPSSSSGEVQDRSIWDNIWKAKVPPKVKIFGWRVATSSLATKKNKFRRTLELDAICNICGVDEEDEFHAVLECTKSSAVREALRKVWDLPPEVAFLRTGPDWL